MVRNLLKKNKKFHISEETYVKVAEAIKEENPAWAGMETDILVLFVKLACMRFKPEDFEGTPEEELREKIRNAFASSPEAQSVTPDQIQQLNNAWAGGKKMGKNMRVIGNTIMRKALRQLEKSK